jgi:hypothetical protein
MTANRFYYEEDGITLLFRVGRKEECEALSAFRAAFGGATDLEAITEDIMAPHIGPSYSGCPCDGQSWGGGVT